MLKTLQAEVCACLVGGGRGHAEDPASRGVHMSGWSVAIAGSRLCVFLPVFDVRMYPYVYCEYMYIIYRYEILSTSIYL